MGPESFGKLSFASALVALFMPIAGFGSINSLRALSTNNSYVLGLTESAFCVRLVGSTLFTLSLLLFALNYGDLVLGVLLFFGGLISFLSSFDVLDVRLLSELRGDKIALIDFIQSISNVVLASIFFLTSVGSVIIFGALPMISKALRTLILLKFNPEFQLKKVFAKANKEAIIMLLSRGWILLISFMAISTYSKIDKLMIGFYLDQSDVAIYSVADQVLSSISSVFVVITTSAYPRLLESAKSSTVYEYLKYMFFAGLCLSLFTFAFIPLGLEHIFG